VSRYIPYRRTSERTGCSEPSRGSFVRSAGRSVGLRLCGGKCGATTGMRTCGPAEAAPDRRRASWTGPPTAGASVRGGGKQSPFRPSGGHAVWTQATACMAGRNAVPPTGLVASCGIARRGCGSSAGRSEEDPHGGSVGREAAAEPGCNRRLLHSTCRPSAASFGTCDPRSAAFFFFLLQIRRSSRGRIPPQGRGGVAESARRLVGRTHPTRTPFARRAEGTQGETPPDRSPSTPSCCSRESVRSR